MVQLGDIVTMRKAHPCGSNKFKIMRTGADYKLCCLGCEHIIMLTNISFNKQLKKVDTISNDVK